MLFQLLHLSSGASITKKRDDGNDDDWNVILERSEEAPAIFKFFIPCAASERERRDYRYCDDVADYDDAAGADDDYYGDDNNDETTQKTARTDEVTPPKRENISGLHLGLLRCF